MASRNHIGLALDHKDLALDLSVMRVPTFIFIRNEGRKSFSLRELTMVSSIEAVNSRYVPCRAVAEELRPARSLDVSHDASCHREAADFLLQVSFSPSVGPFRDLLGKSLRSRNS